LGELDGVPVHGFAVMVAHEFKTKGHSPEMANGPQSLGLLVTWAKQYRTKIRGTANVSGAGS